MAIKVGGTTVIDDSRQLSNITSVDATTVAALGTAGVGAGGGSFDAVASGTLPDGTTVIVNSDGTVSAVSGSAFSQSVGPVNTASAIGFERPSAIYDTVSNKVIYAFKNGANSDKGTIISGTVSGTTITFGSPYIYYNGSSGGPSICYDASDNRIVIAFRDGGSGYGKIINGTVSGTSFNFNSADSFNTAGTEHITAVYDPVAERTVVFYKDQGNGNTSTCRVLSLSGGSFTQGSEIIVGAGGEKYLFDSVYDPDSGKIIAVYTNADQSHRLAAVVATVSGLNVTFGSEAFISAGNASEFNSVTYDTNAQKVVVVYRNTAASNVSSAVGSVSGTSITFGTPIVVYGTSVNFVSISYDDNAKKVLVSYGDGGNSNKGTYHEGTVSGSSITFGSSIVFNVGDSLSYTPVVYDPDTQKSILAMWDGTTYGTNGGNLEANVISVSGVNSNLTDDNFIGFSDGGYTNGQTATIKTISSVNDTQTGLTAGKRYHVAADGTLSEPVPPGFNVFAGTAVSATEIIVKG